MNIIKYLKNLHDDSIRLLSKIEFDKHHALHFALLSLYGSIIEMVGCILVLINNRGRLGVPILFRSLLECYVEFYNLVRDPTYGYHMDASDAKEWLRVLKAASDTRNSYLSEIAKLPNLSEIIANTEGELRNLSNRGFNPLSIRDRFERANMIDEYESFYNCLCTETHSNKRALIDRHVELDGVDYKLIVYKNAPEDEYFHYLDCAAGYLASATVSIHEKMETDAIDEAVSFRRTLDIVRASYKDRT